MPMSAYARKAALDWLCLGNTPTRPTQLWVGLSLGTPSSISGSENAATSGYTRATLVMGAAASPGGSAVLGASVVFAAAKYGSTVRGFQIWDTQAVGSGNMLWYGMLSAATMPASASQFTCATFNLSAQ